MSVNVYDSVTKTLTPVAGNIDIDVPGYCGSWSSGTTYNEKSIVKHNGKLWIALKDNATEPTDSNTTNWQFYILEPLAVSKSSTNGNVLYGSSQIQVYSHPTTAGNKHIPTSGSSGQLLGYSASGTAKWVNTGYNVSSMTVSSDGKTIRFTYADKSYDTLVIDPFKSYTITSYNSSGTKLSAIVYTVGTNNAITITKS